MNKYLKLAPGLSTITDYIQASVVLDNTQCTNSNAMQNLDRTKCLVGNKVGFLSNQAPSFSPSCKLISIESAQDIVRHCKEHNTPAILPIDLAEQELVIRNRQHLEDCGILFLLSDWEVVITCHNKLSLITKLNAKGFGNLIPPMLKHFDFPCIVKRIYDNWGAHSYLLRTPRDIELLEIDNIQTNYIIQKFIPGQLEFASHVLFSQGTIKHIITVKYRHESEYHIQGKNCPPLSSEYVSTSSKVADTFQQILSALDYRGICCIDYKIDDQGLPIIFEINPRVGASLTYNRNIFDRMVQEYLSELAPSSNAELVSHSHLNKLSAT